MKSPHKLSKSQYIKGLQCPKALWFYRHRKDLSPPIEEATEARLQTGNGIGQLAMQYFKDGVEVTGNYWDIEKAVLSTKNFIKQGKEVIFEATAINPNDGGYARIDVLKKVPNTNKWDLIEVKSSTQVKDYHLDDMSFQYHVFTGAGYKIRQCFMMLINNTYVRKGKINPKKLFKMVDITDEVKEKQEEVEKKLPFLTSVLNKRKEPNAEIGNRCSNPFGCEYCFHCWKDVPNYSVFDVYRANKVEAIIDEIDSYDINDIPSELFPNDVKAIDIKCYQKKKKHIEKKEIKAWLSELEYPLYFLDYESIMSAIPLFDGTRPFQQIVFQFSLHVQEKPKSKLEHFEFIHKECSDPQKQFAKALVDLCGKSGSVIVYNKAFEMTRNKELAELFPEYKKKLLKINDRVVDLLVPFKKRWLYSPKQESSASIKAVLPAFTKLKYDTLKIANGAEAMESYLNFMKGNLSEEETKALWQGLSKYCELDTYAMVELLNVLKKAVK